MRRVIIWAIKANVKFESEIVICFLLFSLVWGSWWLWEGVVRVVLRIIGTLQEVFAIMIN